MTSANSAECQAIIDRVCTYIKSKAPQESVKLIQDFAQRYLSAASLDDLRSHDTSTLYGLLYTHWLLINARVPGETRVKVFNPTMEDDGWYTPHTVIQISHDDMPFLVDSTRMVVNRYGYSIHFILHFGGLKVVRTKKGAIKKILPRHVVEPDTSTEAPIYIEIDCLENADDREQLAIEIGKVLDDVRLSVVDWRKMVSRVEDCLHELEKSPTNLDVSELTESRDFLRWLINNNFTFLGSRDYRLIGDGTTRALQAVPGSGLGVLRDEMSTASAKSYAAMPPQARKMALSKDILIIAKTNTLSTVHRQTYTDYIGVKRFDDQGNLIGERRFIGLYTSTAYNSSPKHIPFLRHKVDKVLYDLGFPPDSHDGKEAVHILETLPRDDLFQATQDELVDLTRSIIQIKERRNIRLLVRRDAFQRYFSCLVYLPREIFNTSLASAIEVILLKELHGVSSIYTTYFSDSVLARLHFQIRVNPKDTVKYELEKIEAALVAAARSWSDDLYDELIEYHGEAKGLSHFNKYKTAFLASYREAYIASEAIKDIQKMESLSEDKTLGLHFCRDRRSDKIRMKLYHIDETIILSDVLPIFENMGLRIISEQSHHVIHDGQQVWINDFELIYASDKTIDIPSVKDTFKDAFANIWFGNAENDGFNRLVLEANLNWRQTAMLRAYTKYLWQTGFTFSQTYVEATLVDNIAITKALVKLFARRFDPKYKGKDDEKVATLIRDIEKKLDDVKSLDEDRIIRRLLEVMLATLRTNYYQHDANGKNKSYISFKFDPDKISDLPLPRPKYEVFVYSPRVEGVHLRTGKVARGGLRWSDRREDFRTEILGLMKAQQVKNSVIVPQGAKGGFVVKQQMTPDMSRDDYMQEVIGCYTIFISGLLDITDNIVDGKVKPPKRVVRYDEDDPYLVVAADKGTATFSDIANGIAKDYGFWLDDAFASGGSAGYDHKKMGITSRGAWVSVKRHFSELGINPESDVFTCVGIGDMAGDVFGNGMLLSKTIKLLGAFNHMHIFIDPDPDPAKSYAERKRLFNLPRSAWSDYDEGLISKGGGVFSRAAKSIRVTPEMKKAFGIKRDTIVPNELIKAILRAKVDLIWNGGIGTFVKSTQESHLDAGDRTNDVIRVDATELCSRVIAEGGNLGMTQLARIEYSLNGGIVNTDFIDNSAGVDCSDHEVNIKILLNKLVASGEMTQAQRNKLLEKMTEEVAELVLFDNYEQTLMLSLESSVSQQTMDLFRQYITDMEKIGRIDRSLEYLPDDKALAERKMSNKPLTRPEIAVLLAYSKLHLKEGILSSELPEDEHFNQYLQEAFPKPLREKYHAEMLEHSLRREIIATQLCKNITDRMGINFVERLQRETGASIEFIVRSYSIATTIYDMEKMWKQITSLDGKVTPFVKYRMMLQVYYLIRRATRWFLRNRKPSLSIQSVVEEFKQPIAKIVKLLPKLLDDDDKAGYESVINGYIDEGVSAAMAKQIASCNVLFTSLDIVETANRFNLDLEDVAKTYYKLGNRLELNWLREQMNAYVVESLWDELARAGFRDDLDRAQRKLSAKVLGMRGKSIQSKEINERIDIWINRCQFLIERWQSLLADIKSSDVVDFVTYSVVLRELFDFASAA